MTPKQKLLVQATFERANQGRDALGEYFYRNLFALAPDLRSMFTTDIQEQGKRLTRVIALAVKGLDHPEETAEILRGLGQRHRQYGTQPRHFDHITNAFISALEVVIGERISPDIREAWAAFYAELIEVMTRGMEQNGKESFAV